MNTQPQQVEITDFSAFLKEAGWGDASVEVQSGDAGLRRYFKLEQEEKSALLMDMSRSDYESGLEFYLNIAEFLRDKNIRVPEIYHHDLKQGLAIIENLGAESFGDALKSGTDKNNIYRLATDVLVNIREGALKNSLKLKPYSETLIRDRLIQFVDFYMPAVIGKEATDQNRQEFQDVWASIEKSLSPCPLGFCHADYHLENLMWRPDAPEGYGLIDFQDAFWGPLPYDLLNLLEDARQSVPQDIKTAMKDLYCVGMSAEERAIFDDWYVVLSAHFHCRVIGLFVKLYQEREMDQYLEHIPRLQAYITDNLENPVLAPLKEFIESHNISLDTSPV